MPEFIEYLFFYRLLGLEIGRVFQTVHDFLFRIRQRFGDIDADVDEQISRTVAVHRRQSFIAQAEHLAWLGARFAYPARF